MNEAKIAFDNIGSQVSVIMNSLLKDQDAHKANPNCPHCKGTGTTWVQTGPDDSEPEPCDCVVNTY